MQVAESSNRMKHNLLLKPLSLIICNLIKNSLKKTNEKLTHGIVHAGFIGLQWFVARKKDWCKLIGYRFVIPHDTIPSPLAIMCALNGAPSQDEVSML
jgi:hypothetical protein